MSWSWALLGGGALIGAVGAVGSYLVGRRARIDSNRWTAYTGYVALSALIAIAAALTDSVWPLVGFGFYVLIANFALPLILLPRALQRQAPHDCESSRSSCSAEACATCPLGAQAQAKLESA